MAFRALQHHMKDGGQHLSKPTSMASLVSFKQRDNKLSIGAAFLLPYKSSEHSAPGSFVVTNFDALPATAPLVDVVDESIEGEIHKEKPALVKRPLFTRLGPGTIAVHAYEIKRTNAPKTEVRQLRSFQPSRPYIINVGDVMRVGVATKGGALPTTPGVPVVLGNFYLQMTQGTDAKPPAIFPSAENVIEVVLPTDEKLGRALIREELFPTLLPYEQQHIPRAHDEQLLAQLDAQPITPLSQPVDHQYRQPPATLISVNTWHMGDLVDADPLSVRFALPDASWCHDDKSASGGLAIGITSHRVSARFVSAAPGSSTLVPTLESTTSFRALDYARFGEEPYVTGVNSLRGFESALVQLHGYWPLTAALLAPHASLGRPPVPTYELVEWHYTKSMADMLNTASGAGQRQAAGVNQVMLGTKLAIVNRVAEYTRRYGALVSRAWVERRFTKLRVGSYEQKDLAMPMENDGLTYDQWQRKMFTDGRSPVRADNLFQPATFEHHPEGYIILDGQSERLDRYLQDDAQPFDYYAICVAREVPEALALPLEDDPELVAKIGEAQAPRRCALKTPAESEDYVRRVLDHFRKMRPALAKKYPTLTDDALLDAALHMQEPYEYPMKEGGARAKKSREPIFMYIAIPRNYRPLDPGAIVQPSARAPKVDVPAAASAPSLKRARDENSGPGSAEEDERASKAARTDENAPSTPDPPVVAPPAAELMDSDEEQDFS